MITRHCDPLPAKRKRGRPKTSKVPPTSAKEILKKQINELIDQNLYIVNVEEDKTPIHILPRGRCQSTLPDFFDSRYDEVSSELRKLLHEYHQKEEKEESRPCPDSLYVCKEMEDLHATAKENNCDLKTVLQMEEEEEDLEAKIDAIDDVEEPKVKCVKIPTTKNSRTTYLRMKAPLPHFEDEALSKLPEQKQQILRDNYSSIFNEKITYQEQIETVLRLIYDPKRGSHSGPTYIGMLFGVSGGTISTHYKRMQKERRSIVGRPGALSEEELQILYLFVVDGYQKKSSPNVVRLVDFCFNEFHLSIKEDTLSKIIKKHDLFKSVTGVPLESTRAEVPVEIVLNHYERLDAVLTQYNIPPAFFYNVDESGFQEFVDAIKEAVIVPSYCVEDEVYYSTNRAAKRATLIGCICADGSALKPLIITTNKTVQTQLIQDGYGPENCLIVYQSNGFITSEVFAFWADHVFFPSVKQKRVELGYDGPVILSYDGCSAHISDYFLDEASFHGVYPWQEPAGTSDQVQALDLGIFGIQKRKRTKTSKEGYNEASKTIINIVNSWRSVTTPDNVVSAFNQAGIFSETTEEYTRMRASANKGRAVRGVDHVPCHNLIFTNKTSKIPQF